jgi:uncharacterized protein (TIGR00369 family)
VDFSVRIPFVEHLGFRLVLFEGGLSQIDYEPTAEHLNSFEVTHGGALMTLLDVTMGTAARSAAPELGALTIEMKTSFMRPARGKLSAKGRLVHRTPAMAFTEAIVYDAHGHACCHATGTFKYVKRRSLDPARGAPGVIATD